MKHFFNCKYVNHTSVVTSYSSEWRIQTSDLCLNPLVIQNNKPIFLYLISVFIINLLYFLYNIYYYCNIYYIFAFLQAVPGKVEAELANGLICGHAYSITSVRMVSN